MAKVEEVMFLFRKQPQEKIELLQLLRNIQIFKEVDLPTLRKVVNGLKERKLKKGEVLFYKGDTDYSLYIVQKGMVKAHIGTHTYATFGPKQYFGEYSLLDSTPRSTSISALSDTDLIWLPQEQFNELLNKKPEFAKGLLKGLVWRLRDYNVLEAELTNKNQEIRKQKEEIEQQRLELETLNHTKDKFFAIIAHDLRNPFSTVLSLSELLAKEFENFEPEKLKMFISQIYKYSNNTFNLLENLLQWSLLQTGRLVARPKGTNLADVINENIELLKGNAQQKGIELVWINPSDCFAFFDSNMITTVIRNLISNAIKFCSEAGRIEVELSVDSEYCRVSIKDNGTGIPPENVAKLFKLESNPSTEGTSQERGTGLGLILCKEFVEKNGGTIGVRSKEGEGSLFFFSVPRFEKKE